MSLIREVGFTSLFTFIFSPRNGTPAAKMDEQITKEEKARRCHILQKTCDDVRNSFLSSLVGSVQSVLFETPKDGAQRGYTKNYTPVKVFSDIFPPFRG